MGDFDLSGINFNQIPDDAVGILADNNNLPLANINENHDNWLFDIVSKENTSMRLTQRIEAAHGRSTYLGGIVSRNRSIIYWVNDSKPLP